MRHGVDATIWTKAPQAWRDLWWLVYAPAFWPWDLRSAAGVFGHRLWSPARDDTVRKWLLTQAHDPSELCAAVNKMAQPNHPDADYLSAAQPMRLGRLAEALFTFFIQKSPAVDWIASGVPIYAPPETGKPGRQQLGELDALWRDDTGALVHAELAVKFYALAKPSTPAGLAIGPDGVENWQHKFDKLCARQLTHALPPPWDAEPVKRLAHVRGRWFLPGHDVSADDWVSVAPDGLRFGPRFSRAQFATVSFPRNCKVRFLRRLEWLGPVSQPDDHRLFSPGNDGLLDVAALVSDAPVHSHERVQMLGVFKSDAAGAWHEEWRAWIDPERPAEPTIGG